MSRTMNPLDYSKRENRVLGNVLRAQARAIPGQCFIVADEHKITYRQAYEQVRRYAVGLARLGVGQHDRVCIFMHSCPEFVCLAFACNLLGAQWVPVNTDYRGEWLARTLADSEPKALVSDRTLLPRIDALAGQVAGTLVVKGGDGLSLESLAEHDTRGFEDADARPGDVASIMWTSGTTGRSKGVMQSHNVWIRSATASAELYDYREGDITYNCLPLYNSAAWTANIYPALVSGTTVALDTAFSANHFWDRIRLYQATHAFTVGAMHIFLWNAPPAPDDSDNPLRAAIMTPMPAEIHRPFCRRFGIERIHQGFGQSEIMLLLQRVDDGVNAGAANSLGHAVDDVEVALLDDGCERVPVGEIGEFCVKPKAEHVLFSGYFNDPQATEAAYAGGWFHTGDLGHQDEAGNYYFDDRKKDLIRYKGRSVSSMAVESVARRHPSVQDVAAYGITSDELASEHEIMLAVVLKAGASVSEEELARLINDNAPHFFVPRYIEFMSGLPMTPTQKVRKVELRARGVTGATWDAKSAGFKVVR